jgi:hypothetical protein
MAMLWTSTCLRWPGCRCRCSRCVLIVLPIDQPSFLYTSQRCPAPDTSDHNELHSLQKQHAASVPASLLFPAVCKAFKAQDSRYSSSFTLIVLVYARCFAGARYGSRAAGLPRLPPILVPRLACRLAAWIQPGQQARLATCTRGEPTEQLQLGL